ncbi:MAG TPA: hypothetical protein VMT35_13160, partial [Ignavibacteriaceae bacterium]|nr:hypothetical protein [Ignavibacteriaceae bacterium]
NHFKNNNGCYQLYFIHEAGHGYGFSSDYVSKAVSNFVSGVLSGKCSSDEIENKGNISLSYTDPDSAAEMVVENKTVSLNPEALQDYAGQYQGHEVLINVSVEGDHLKVETAGEETHELYPVKEDVFVEKQLNIQAVFTRDAGGNVIEHRVLLNQNREFVYKKIK